MKIEAESYSHNENRRPAAVQLKLRLRLDSPLACGGLQSASIHIPPRFNVPAGLKHKKAMPATPVLRMFMHQFPKSVIYALQLKGAC